MLAVAALLFGRIATDMPVPTGRSVRHDLAEGIRYVRKDNSLLGILALGTVPGVFLMGPFAVTVVLMVEDVFEASDKYVGLLWGSLGGGIVFGSLLMSMFRSRHRGRMLTGSVLFGGSLWALYGLSSSLPLSMALAFVAGIAGPAIFINFAVALLQENTDRQMMGRVMSMYGLSFSASIPLGYAQAGIQASLWGPQATIVSSAAIATAIGLLAFFFLRAVNRLP
jgi:MFS family permease